MIKAEKYKRGMLEKTTVMTDKKEQTADLFINLLKKTDNIPCLVVERGSSVNGFN